MPIQSSKKGLTRTLVEGGVPKKGIQPRTALAARTALTLLDAAHSPKVFETSGYRLKRLQGALSAYYAIRVDAQWRIIFRWVDGNAYDVALVDYHANKKVDRNRKGQKATTPPQRSSRRAETMARHSSMSIDLRDKAGRFLDSIKAPVDAANAQALIFGQWFPLQGYGKPGMRPYASASPGFLKGLGWKGQRAAKPKTPKVVVNPFEGSWLGDVFATWGAQQDRRAPSSKKFQVWARAVRRQLGAFSSRNSRGMAWEERKRIKLGEYGLVTMPIIDLRYGALHTDSPNTPEALFLRTRWAKGGRTYVGYGIRTKNGKLHYAGKGDWDQGRLAFDAARADRAGFDRLVAKLAGVAKGKGRKASQGFKVSVQESVDRHGSLRYGPGTRWYSVWVEGLGDYARFPGSRGKKAAHKLAAQFRKASSKAELARLNRAFPWKDDYYAPLDGPR